jgi:hypothetical protein
VSLRRSYRIYQFIVYLSFNWHSGGEEGEVKLSPLGTTATNGLLSQPLVIMVMEKLVEWWLAGEIEALGESLPQCRFVHHKLHMPARTRTRFTAVRTQRLTATAWPIVYLHLRQLKQFFITWIWMGNVPPKLFFIKKSDYAPKRWQISTILYM